MTRANPALVFLAVACAGIGCTPETEEPADSGEWSISQEARPDLPADTINGVVVETVVTGLSVPWAIDFASDGRLFLTERDGRVRLIEEGALDPRPWAELDVYSRDDFHPESGLLGLAIDPDFDAGDRLYLMATEHDQPGGRVSRLFDRVRARLTGADPSSPWTNRLYRITRIADGSEERSVVLDGIPANRYHAGSAVAFGPDGMLYLTVGDALEPEAAQDTAAIGGKLLRLTRDGAVPADNPFQGSPVYALGLRNSQGIAWHPEGETLFATEHGEIGHDELNVIQPGANYGWPLVEGVADDPRFVDPISEWTPAIAPSGLDIVRDPDHPWYGDLIVAALRGRQLRRIVVARDDGAQTGWRVVEEQTLLHQDFGRLRAVRSGPDGWIYFTTSNRDGRGDPGEHDDRLLRMRPLDREDAR